MVKFGRTHLSHISRYAGRRHWSSSTLQQRPRDTKHDSFGRPHTMRKQHCADDNICNYRIWTKSHICVSSISKTTVHCLRHGVIFCLHCQICHGRSMWFLHDLNDDCFGGRRVVAWYGISIVIQVSDVSRPRRNARGEDFLDSMPSEVWMQTEDSRFRSKSFD